MQRAHSTMILLVVFVALSTYVYFVELERPPASAPAPQEPLVELRAEDISSLTIAVGPEETLLARTGDTDSWQLTRPVSAAADDIQVTSITSALASLEIQRVIDEAAVDLTPFGLAEPIIEIGFVVSGDPKEHRLLIGDTNPTGAERYAKMDDGDRVILISSHLNATFSKSTFDLRDKTILGFEIAGIDQFQITSREISMRFVKDQNKWRMVEPSDVRADFRTVEGVVGQLRTGQMRSIETEELDGSESAEETRAAYGLSEPNLTATVNLGSVSATLLVGNRATDSTYYAQDASRPVVFTIDSALVTDLERDSIEYRDKQLFDSRPFTASRVEIEREEAILVFEKTETEGNDAEVGWTRVAPAPAEVDQSAMDNLLAKLLNLRAESFVESWLDLGLDPNSVLATIRVRFGADTVRDVEAVEEQVTLWRFEDITYGVHRDEPGAAVLSPESVDDAIEALETVQAKGA